MGTDSVKLFDKILADQILAMDQQDLVGFLEKNLGELQHKPFVLNPVFFEMTEHNTSVSETVARVLATECNLSDLKVEIAQDFGFGNEEIHLDYWGCYAKVFRGHPEGSISSLDYLHEELEETFLLLRPEHVKQMTKSLREHIDDVTVMDLEAIEKLERWTDLCVTRTGYYVAYLFDF